MGSLWLSELPDWFEDAGLEVRCWDGWETRSRSSGGYTQLWGAIVHHTASNTSPDNDCSYMWDATSGDQPIGALLLERSGRVTIGAAGATNCAGKGGPLATSKGTIPADSGNSYAFNIEAANNGVGETWPDDQQDAYTILVACLCDHLDLDSARDVVSHFEWAPDRKIDPAGNSRYASGGDKWDMDAFRTDCIVGTPTPTPPEEDELTEEQMNDLVERTAQRTMNLVWSRQTTDPGAGDQASTLEILQRTSKNAKTAAGN